MHRVHTENLTKSEKRQIWDEIIQDYLSSEQSVRVYSEVHGLKVDHLSYYVSTYKRKQKQSSSSFVLASPSLAPTNECITISNNALNIKLPMSSPLLLIENLLKLLQRAC